MIPAVILAAGLSSRMGRSKALLPLESGQTFIERIVRTFMAAGVADVVIVLGHEAAALGEAIDGFKLPVRTVVNRAFATGQLSSVLAGVNAVDRPGTRAMLMTLVDVPLVSSSTVRAVVERFDATGAPVVRPVHGADHGHPVLLSRVLFPLLRQADPDAGAKPIVRRHVSPAGDVEVSDPGAFLDIDTPEEYLRVLDQIRDGRWAMSDR